MLETALNIAAAVGICLLIYAVYRLGQRLNAKSAEAQSKAFLSVLSRSKKASCRALLKDIDPIEVAGLPVARLSTLFPGLWGELQAQAGRNPEAFVQTAQLWLPLVLKMRGAQAQVDGAIASLGAPSPRQRPPEPPVTPPAMPTLPDLLGGLGR